LLVWFFMLSIGLLFFLVMHSLSACLKNNKNFVCFFVSCSTRAQNSALLFFAFSFVQLVLKCVY